MPSHVIDLEHLSRQTLGDPSLQRDILAIFVGQVEEARDRLRALPSRERAALAHRLAGSARGVGAFALAGCAADMEKDPNEPELVQRLLNMLEEARAAAISVRSQHG